MIFNANELSCSKKSLATSNKTEINQVNRPYQMATVKREKNRFEKSQTQKDVKLENPPKPKPGFQSEARAKKSKNSILRRPLLQKRKKARNGGC